MKLTTEVNFTNMLQVAFVLILFCQKITNPHCKLRKAAQKTFVQKYVHKMLVNLTLQLRVHPADSSILFRRIKFSKLNFKKARQVK